MILLTLCSWARSCGIRGLPKRPHTVSWETNGKPIAAGGGGAVFIFLPLASVLWYGTFGAMCAEIFQGSFAFLFSAHVLCQITLVLSYFKKKHQGGLVNYIMGIKYQKSLSLWKPAYNVL